MNDLETFYDILCVRKDSTDIWFRQVIKRHLENCTFIPLKESRTQKIIQSFAKT